MGEREAFELERMRPLGEAWLERNRSAFLEGYHGTSGIEKLMPKGKSYDAVLRAFELDKALYELSYELSYRPDWAEIPRGAIRRLTGV